jgi:polyhydroxybutyrate depolymerase
MATHYVSQRPETPRREPPVVSRTTYMHHVAWAVVCGILVAIIASLWVYSQSLAGKNVQLQRQLTVAKAPATTCKVGPDWKADMSRELSVDTRDGKRSFYVHLPTEFIDNQYYPMIMFYSGKGALPLNVELAYGLDRLPAILVYPFPTNGKDGDLSWASAPYSSGADDIGFTAAILDELQADLCVDKTRIYAAGMSNGGGFASMLSCKLPDRFAAYAIVAGALYAPSSNCTPPRPSSIISIHGDNDETVPYDGSPLRQLPPIYDWTAQRAAIEKCSKPIINYTDPTRTITTWPNCRAGTTVESVRVLGGTHAWGDVSNDTIWRFLSRFSL